MTTPIKNRKEAAAFCKVSVPYLDKLRLENRGGPKYYLCGKRVLYHEKDLLRWIMGKQS